MQTVIETKALCKQYGPHTAVDHVELHVPQGCVYGFIGPNGAGKSTTMKMLLGLIHPTAGRVRLLGQELTEKSRLPLLRQTGSLIESPAGYLHLTAQENLEIVADLKGVPHKDIGRVLDIVHLTQDRNRRVGQYSLGMKQRLAIGIALLGHPEFLVLDEPINGLDPAGIKEIRDVILALNQKKGVTFLVSSHLLDELSKIVTTYGIIKDGVLIEQITAKELEGRFRHHLKLRVDNIPKAQALLECIADPKAIKVQDDCIYLFDLLDKSDKVNRLLVRHGIKVSELSMQTSSLEEYFLERMGK